MQLAPVICSNLLSVFTDLQKNKRENNELKNCEEENSLSGDVRIKFGHSCAEAQLLPPANTAPRAPLATSLLVPLVCRRRRQPGVMGADVLVVCRGRGWAVPWDKASPEQGVPRLHPRYTPV